MPSAHASDDLWVLRVDRRCADAAGLLEPHSRPGLAGVGGLVDPFADRDVAANLRLAGARPDDVRIGGRDGERADRLRPAGRRRSAASGRRRRWSCRCRPTRCRRNRRADRRHAGGSREAVAFGTDVAPSQVREDVGRRRRSRRLRNQRDDDRADQNDED